MSEKEFREILSEFLKAHELTQTAFALKVGVKPSQVSEWLKGKSKPGYDTIKRIAVNFEVPAEYFLGIINEF